MIYIDSSDDTLDKKVKAVCAPIFASDQFLQSGHTEDTTNATVTFIQLEARVYAVTCHHVLAAFLSEALKTGHRVVPSIHSGRAIHQFHWYGPQGQYRWSFMSCRDFPSFDLINDEQALANLARQNSERPDIAIADLSDIWPVLRDVRGAEAINLDDWVEPEWSASQPVWLAFGFPDGHKYNASDMLAAPMPRVAVELASSVPSPERPTYTLCSTLAVEHGWGFSGLSGGPVLVAHTTEDRYAYIGITFEGSPSTKELEINPESFLGKRDILLMGYYLTPTIFRDWLSKLKFGVEIS